MLFLEQARKAVVAVIGVGLVYAGIAADILGSADLSTRDGIISAVFALLVGFGVYSVKNEDPA